MDRRSQFQEAKNFTIYYGHGMEEKLSNYDVAIIESRGHSPEGLKVIKARKCLAIAYISLVEINPSDYYYRYLKDEDFIHCNGKVEINSIYGNYLVDIQSKRWQDILMHECGKLLDGLDYDGIFIDTIGNVENHKILKEYNSALICESVLLFARLRSKYPQHIIIQNNAIERLIHFTSGIIDGICWENPPVDKKSSRLWMQEIINSLNKIKEIDKLKVFVVLESENLDDARKLQLFDNLGYLTYLSSFNYLNI
ncbi:MAG: glycoside hydrolase family 66 protein [Herbinix sp.]|nr:glycoside hydrolase family 66 protein [Herbinix sp.]